MSSIITIDENINAGVIEMSELCEICTTTPSKYSCPRCELQYCSLSCYKSQQHLQCSESFYKECIEQELAVASGNDSKRDGNSATRSMVEILKRFEETVADDVDDDRLFEVEPDMEELDSDDDTDGARELAERLSGIDLDNADAVWDRLTEAEKQEFQILLENGDIAKVIPVVDCWWTKQFKVQLIQSATEGLTKEEQALLAACPAVCSKIKRMADISAKEPSPLIRHGIANILAAYAFVVRHYNGDIHENAPETANSLIAISANLKSNAIFQSDALAIESVTHDCRTELLPADQDTVGVLKDDVSTFFNGPQDCGQKYRQLFLLAALSDVHRLLQRALADYNKLKANSDAQKNVEAGQFSQKFPNGNPNTLTHINGSILRTCAKKIEFLLSYAKELL